MGICVAADHSILLFLRHADRAEKAGEGSGQQNPDPFSDLVCSRYTAYEHVLQRLDHWNRCYCDIYWNSCGVKTYRWRSGKGRVYIGRTADACLQREVCGRGSCSNRSRTCNRNHILWFLPYEMERGESTAGSGIRGDKNASGLDWISGQWRRADRHKIRRLHAVFSGVSS